MATVLALVSDPVEPWLRGLAGLLLLYLVLYAALQVVPVLYFLARYRPAISNLLRRRAIALSFLGLRLVTWREEGEGPRSRKLGQKSSSD